MAEVLRTAVLARSARLPVLDVREAPVTVEWQTPPPPRLSNGVRWLSEADELRTRPGEWARITDGRSPHSARSMVWQINSGALVAFRPAGDYEGCARDGTVFARWLGDGELPD